MKDTQLATMPADVDPVVQQRTRRKMVTWYTRMAHKAEFDDQASFESYGDVIHNNMPTLRDFLLGTASVWAIAVGSAKHGTA